MNESPPSVTLLHPDPISLKAGGMHSGNASEDWSALGQIIKDNAN